MPSKSKIKGNTGERKVVECCQANDVPAVRAWGSNGRSIGHHEEVDVLIDDQIKVQVKVRKSISKYLIPSEEVDLVVFKQDRGKLLVLMDFEDWLTDYRTMMELTNRV